MYELEREPQLLWEEREEMRSYQEAGLAEPD